MKTTMKKQKIKSILFVGTLLWFMAGSYSALASTTGGAITTGINSNDVVATLIAAPIANPIGGTFAALQYVALTASGSKEIRWTVDGTVPDCTTATTKYNVEIPIGVSSTIRAISCYPNNKFSSVASFVYVINPPATVTPPPGSGGSGGGSGGSGGGGGTPPTPIVDDMTGDGKVNIFDFALLMSNWGKTGTNTSDLNNDSKVDILDFALLMLNWGK